MWQAEEGTPGRQPVSVHRRAAARAGSGAAQKLPGLPKPQAAKERGGVKFAPRLEIVSEAPAREKAAALGQETSSVSSILSDSCDACARLKPAIRCAPFYSPCHTKRRDSHAMCKSCLFVPC